MKVIFLDVDGVLNSERFFKERKDKGTDIDKTTIPLLKKIVLATDAKIVLSSTWRTLRPRKGDELFDDLSAVHAQFKQLVDALAEFNLEILSYTKDMSLSGWARGNEIRDWLSENSHLNIESFVILDDDGDMCEFTETNLVKTTWLSGIDKHHVRKAINILNKVKE